MSFSPKFVPKGLPDNLSGIQTNPDHLLSSVSPTALNRADGWLAGAKAIESTLTDFEKIFNAENANKIPTAMAA